MNAAITTICSTFSFTGTANTVIAPSLDKALSLGSSVISLFEQATAGETIYPSVVNSYDQALRSYVIPLYNAATINDGDVLNAITMNSQIVQVLEAIVATSATHAYPNGYAVYFLDLWAIINYTNIGINRKIGMIDCEVQNSLNSIQSVVSSEFSVVHQQPWVSFYFSQRPSAVTVPSVSCSRVCVTSTIEATTTANTESTTMATTEATTSATETTASTTEATTSTTEATTESTTEATTTESTSGSITTTESTSGSTAEATTESTTEATTTESTSGSTVESTSESTTEATTATSESTNTGLETSSRTISGSIQRCLVRPTSVTLTSTTHGATSTSDGLAGVETSSSDTSSTLTTLAPS